MDWKPTIMAFSLAACAASAGEAPAPAVATTPAAPAAKPAPLRTGPWRAALAIQPGIEVPFLFDLSADPGGKITLVIRNAEERIKVDEVERRGDSLLITLPVFDSGIRAAVSGNAGDTLRGRWWNHAKKDTAGIPFLAVAGRQPRFPRTAPADSQGRATAARPVRGNPARVQGRWDAVFSPGTPEASRAVGEFAPFGKGVRGTFLTETGDYRYLEGTLLEDRLLLSCFDGARAYFFSATLKGDSLVHGDFRSFTDWKEAWVARRNPKAALRDADSLARARNALDTLDFAFPDLDGNRVTLRDARFQDKVVIVQVMGSWCANCMDETAYLAEFHRKWGPKGVEVVGLAYEREPDPARARRNLRRLAKRFGAEYPFLLTGLTGKAGAARSLPALDTIRAFPTTLYLDRLRRIRRVNTGFSGPATGQGYRDFIRRHEALVTALVKEPSPGAAAPPGRSAP